MDVLEQMDLMDISDQEALDVFLNSGSGADEGALASPLPGALYLQVTNTLVRCLSSDLYLCLIPVCRMGHGVHWIKVSKCTNRKFKLLNQCIKNTYLVLSI